MPGRRSPRRPPEVARGEHAKKAFKGGLGGASYLPAPIRYPDAPNNDEHDEVLFWQDLYQGNGVRNSFPLTYLPIQNSERVYLQAVNSTQSKYCRQGPDAVWVKTHTRVEGASGTDNVTFHQAPPEGTMVVVDYAYRPTAPPCADTGPPGSPYLLRLSEDIHNDPRWPYWETREWDDQYGWWYDSSYIWESFNLHGLITLDYGKRIVFTVAASAVYDEWNEIHLDGPNVRAHVVQISADGKPERLAFSWTPVPLHPGAIEKARYYTAAPFYDEVKLLKVPGERSVIALMYLDASTSSSSLLATEHLPLYLCDYYTDMSIAGLSYYRDARMVIRYDFSEDYKAVTVRWSKVIGHWDYSWSTTEEAMGGWSGGNTIIDGVINMVTTTGSGNNGSWTKLRASDGALLSRTYHPFDSGTGGYLMMSDGRHIGYGRPDSTLGVYQYIFDTSTGSTGYTTTSRQNYYSEWQSHTNMSGHSADGSMCIVGDSAFVVLGYNNIGGGDAPIQLAHTFAYGGPSVGFYPTGTIILGSPGGTAIVYQAFYNTSKYSEGEYRCWRNLGWFFMDDHHSNRTTLVADGILYIGTSSETFYWSRYPPVEDILGYPDDLGPMLVRVPSGIPSGPAHPVDVHISHLPRSLVRSEGLTDQISRNAMTKVKGGVVMVYEGHHGDSGFGSSPVYDHQAPQAPPYRTFDFLMRPYVLFFPDA